jgi:CarboxypepD_reg-like domain
MIKKLLSGFIIYSICFSLKAQTLITGKIIDAVSLQPLTAACVQQQDNDKIKTLADNNGNFSLKLNTKNAIITASFIGYKTENIFVANQNNVRIELHPDVVNLKDIIIVQNNGQQNFSTVAKIDLDLKPVKNTQELLRIVPGLFVAQHGGGVKQNKYFYVDLIVIMERIYR